MCSISQPRHPDAGGVPGQARKTVAVDISPRKLEQRVALKNPNAVVEYSQIVQLMEQ
jgi:hypothetical protein